MQLDVFSTFLSVSDILLREKIVIVIDVLRATTNMIYALNNGARQIIPLSDIQETMLLSKTFGTKNTVLAGERNSVKIEGFQLGNSPFEFTSQAIKDKTILMTTTNGTKALNHVKNAQTIIIGALINLTSVAEFASKQSKDIFIVCAGTNKEPSADDIYCAGAMVNKINNLNPDIILSDMAIIAKQFYLLCKSDLSILLSSKHPKILLNSGFKADIDLCLSEDTTNIIPFYQDGSIALK